VTVTNDAVGFGSPVGRRARSQSQPRCSAEVPQRNGPTLLQPGRVVPGMWTLQRDERRERNAKGAGIRSKVPAVSLSCQRATTGVRGGPGPLSPPVGRAASPPWPRRRKLAKGVVNPRPQPADTESDKSAASSCGDPPSATASETAPSPLPTGRGRFALRGVLRRLRVAGAVMFVPSNGEVYERPAPMTATL
jgi:hypothetical protein